MFPLLSFLSYRHRFRSWNLICALAELFGAPPPPAFTAPRPSAPSAPPPPPRSQSYHSVSHYGVSLQPIRKSTFAERMFNELYGHSGLTKVSLVTGYTDDSVKRSVQQQARSQDESWSSAQRPSPFDEPTHGISHMVSSRRSLSRRSAGQEFANTPPPQYEARGERSGETFIPPLAFWNADWNSMLS